jgi:putative transposase
VGAILSQKDGKFERVVVYASKSLTEAQRKFHPMEGECYALIWGVMHFRQYLHMKHFVLRTDHKPLEWLATVSDAHGRRGHWVGLLQDFSFKIMHRPGLKHANVDALSRNPVKMMTTLVKESKTSQLMHLMKKGSYCMFREEER